MRECGCLSTTTLGSPADRADRVTRMRYQELFFSAFVLGAAIASDNCRHPRNMSLRHARSTPMPLPKAQTKAVTEASGDGFFFLSPVNLGTPCADISQLGNLRGPVSKSAPPSDHTPLRRRCAFGRVDPAPNDPGLLAAKGGAAGGGCALMRTLGRLSPPQ